MSKSVIYVLGASLVTACVLSTVYPLPQQFLGQRAGLPENFNSLGRQEQVLVCAGCHPKQYEHEMAGPHANAYNKLVEHLEKLPDSLYHPHFYAAFLEKAGMAYCGNCHASDNLYQYEFSSAHDLSEIAPKYKGTDFKGPKVRGSVESRSTGVDCLTCHYDGKGVITNSQFKPGIKGGAAQSCLPKPSSVFSSDFNCIPCHTEIKGKEDDFYFDGVSENLSCVSCHVERDRDGRSTHYYYWRHGSNDRKGSEPLRKFYEPIRISRAADGIRIDPDKEALPHRLSICPELILDYEILDPLGNMVAGNRVRFNQRPLHIRKTHAVFHGNLLGGTDGLSLNSPLDTSFLIPVSPDHLYESILLRVRGISKPHYWIQDDDGIQVFESLMQLP